MSPRSTTRLSWRTSVTSRVNFRLQMQPMSRRSHSRFKNPSMATT